MYGIDHLFEASLKRNINVLIPKASLAEVILIACVPFTVSSQGRLTILIYDHGNRFLLVVQVVYMFFFITALPPVTSNTKKLWTDLREKNKTVNP